MSRVLLTVILLDVCWLEILWVLDVVEDSAKGGEAIGVVRKLWSTSCVDDILCIHDGVGYLFPIMPTVVVAVWLRPRSLVCLRLVTPGAMTARSFLILLISLVLLLLLLLMLVASGGTACLRYDCCGSP